MEVYKAISAVSKALAHEGISKERRNEQQGYKFRGIDDVMNALGSLLPEHELIIIPNVLEREVVERQTKSGGTLFYVTVKVEFAFISTKDGSRHNAVVYGEAMDSADKSTNKAMSAAYKYAALLTFCVPTEGDHDADATTHEVAATQSADLKAVQAKLQAAKVPQGAPVMPTPAPTHTPPSIASPEPTASQESAFIWQIGKEHNGKPIENIPLNYLTWYVANGKKQDHLEAAKMELAREAAPGNAPVAPIVSTLCSLYLEQITASESIMECETTLRNALHDENISPFDGTALNAAATSRLAFLRKG